MAVTISFDQEINICSETKNGLRDGIRGERSWRLSFVRVGWCRDLLWFKPNGRSSAFLSKESEKPPRPFAVVAVWLF
jgi:hypothetical protein